MSTFLKKLNVIVSNNFSDTKELNNWNGTVIQKQLKTLLCNHSSQDTRKMKDPNAPKRGKSAYLFFCSNFRDEVKKEMGEDSKATDVTRQLGSKWNTLKSSSKASDVKLMCEFVNQANKDKERYASEKEEYVPPDNIGLTKRDGKKKQNGPRRAKSAYLFYCSDMRTKVKEDMIAKGVRTKVTDITKELGSRWNALKNNKSKTSEIAKYDKEAESDKIRYENEKNETINEQATTKTVNTPTTTKIVKVEKTTKTAKTTDDDLIEEDGGARVKKPTEKKKSNNNEKANGYQSFCTAKRPEFKSKFTRAKANEITKKLSSAWNELSQEEKESWK